MDSISVPAIEAPEAGPTSSEPVVHIVDDDPGIARSVRRLVEAAGWPVETYVTGGAFLAASHAINCGCVLVDLCMPGMNGLELLIRLRARGFVPPVIMLSGHGNIPTAVRAIKSGAADFIEKPFDTGALIEVIRRTVKVRDEEECWRERDDATARIKALSPRERQVLNAIVDGHSNKIIAFDLGLSVRTVEVHRARMMERLGLRHMAEAVRLAVLARVDL
jgi:two-component system response regulator FixJ